MGLPKPLGSYGVSFAEFELRRRSEKTRIGESRGTARSGAVAETLPSAEGAVDASFLSHGVEEDVVDFGECSLIKEGRLPVVIFSHGMWACRTTYTATCIDIASHGYIVVAVEHLDGSAVIAQYHDHQGKRRWVEHAFSDVDFNEVPMSDRSRQLRQRVEEIQKTVEVLQALDQGLLSQKSNAIKGRTSLDVKFLQGRMNFDYLAIHGHSFGAATAISVCCVDERFKCCIAEDVWWAPVEKADYERAASNVPVLLLNTEHFNGKELQNSRNKFLRARAQLHGESATTELLTMKGTSHEDQSDFPLLFAKALKRAGKASKLDVRNAKDINSRACLDFYLRNLLPPGTGAPYLVDVVKEDGEHLEVGKIPHSKLSTVV
uniref:1-alkyl-2-acetylglycerophosphocholine esterase n=1 Tax=Physcomitrium patens TaxID=3218 RepID=A0A7I4B4T8_PHYPA